MSIVIYHNPDCGTSRNALAAIRAAGHEPRIIDEVTMPDLPPMHVDNGWLRDGAAPQEVQK